MKAYVAALSGRALYVHSAMDGAISRLGFELELKFRTTGIFWFQKPAHAQLVELRVTNDLVAACLMRPHNWVDMPPGELAELIKSTAATLGAHWQTQEQIEADGKKVVAEVEVQLRVMQNTGELSSINATYKTYRLQKTARGEKATSYVGYLNRYKRQLVTAAALKMSGGSASERQEKLNDLPKTGRSYVMPGWTHPHEFPRRKSQD